MTFDRLHHMQLAMPRDEEQAARDFFVGVLGMIEVDKPPVLAARGGAWSALAASNGTSESKTIFERPAKVIPGFWSPTSTTWCTDWSKPAKTSDGTWTSPGSGACTRTTLRQPAGIPPVRVAVGARLRLKDPITGLGIRHRNGIPDRDTTCATWAVVRLAAPTSPAW